MTVATLQRTMTEAERTDWQDYARRFMLPTRRLQHQLALIAYLIAASGGVKDAKFENYLFVPTKTPKQRKRIIDEAKEFFGFRPRKKVKRGAK